jgi:V8-like Glu-specific endopeptidase
MFILLILLSFNIYAQETKLIESIIPERVIYGHYYVSKGKILRNGRVRVSGTTYNPIDGEYDQSGSSFTITRDVYDTNKALAQAVFKASPENNSSMAGTAFHIGSDYVMTNFHVYHTKYKNVACKRFHIKAAYPAKQKPYYCQKVIHCEKSLDYCILKMKPQKKTGRKLSQGARVKLTRDLPTLANDTKTVVIGNPRGHGVQASSGLGLFRYGKQLLLYSPVWGGNSGSPVFNEKGEAFALVYSQSKNHYQRLDLDEELNFGKHPFNSSYSMNRIYINLEKNPKVPKEVLDLFY